MFNIVCKGLISRDYISVVTPASSGLLEHAGTCFSLGHVRFGERLRTSCASHQYISRAARLWVQDFCMV